MDIVLDLPENVYPVCGPSFPKGRAHIFQIDLETITYPCAYCIKFSFPKSSVLLEPQPRRDSQMKWISPKV